MTVSEAIKQSALLYPSAYDGEKDYVYLNELEQRICSELLFTDCEEITEESGKRVLCADGAYSSIYPLYIAAKRELACGDADRYELFNSVFERAYSDYANFVNRSRACQKATYITTI